MHTHHGQLDMPQISPERLQQLRNLTLAVYILFALAPLTGVTAVIGIIISHLKRDEAFGSIYRSHFSWQIRTFWWSLAWAAVGGVTVMLGVGFVVLAAVWVWSLYRLVRGFLNWIEGKRMPV